MEVGLNSYENFKDEDEAYKNKCFCDIFGCPEKSYYKESMKGRVTFFDAMPTTTPKIALDILNPHYGLYYTEGKPPADYYDPKPIFFLTVMDTNFSFNIGIKNQDNNPIEEGKFKGKELIEITYIYMKDALENHGIGAKTAVGYGYQKFGKN
jgi:CRISPR-associated protein Cmr6